MTAATQAPPADAAGLDLAVDALRSTATVRARARAMLARARAGDSAFFAVHDAALAPTAELVAEVARQRYPTLAVPYHSRWRHFEAGGIDRRAWLDERLGDVAAAERARAQIDLAVVSVLLDAGAGPDWSWLEAESGQRFSRSEGLGVASFHAFASGLFSSDPARPLRADATALVRIDASALARAFQVEAGNPLVGLEGRADLLRRLGAALAAQPQVFGIPARPGGLFDALTQGAGGQAVTAHAILRLLLDTLSGIWPAGNALRGVPLGDCWRHPTAGGVGLAAGWVPFHKLSQWLTYSLLEPFQWAGCAVEGLDALTGLPEYRNGGLLLDGGVLRLRDASLARITYTPADPLVVEWRALTVALLDELAPLVCEALGLDARTTPLACVLEGGTWAAGRVLAQRLRGGTPPLSIDSDGTVF
ncbi:MAG: DUF1688 family protein [Burkholderiaceae bacterium]